jgi:pimeloyl-ACP methyl ester carboxylesterase
MTPLVLLHGGGLGPWSWRRHAFLLEGAFDVHAPVLPGHHGSSTELFDLETAVAEVVALLERLGEPAVLAGLSLGGQLATHVAARRPDLVRCVVASGVNTDGIPGLGLLVASLPLVRLLSRSRAMSRASGKAMGIPPEELDAFVEGGRLSSAQLAAIYRASSASTLPEGLPVDRVLVLAGSKEPGPIRRSLEGFRAAGAASAVVPAGRHTWPLARPELFTACVQAWYDGSPLPADLQAAPQPA